MDEDRTKRVAERLKLAMARNRALTQLIQTTPIEEWFDHPEIMAKVSAEQFDMHAAITRRDIRDRREQDNS